MTDAVEVRFWSKVDKTERCWLWTAGADRYGYGKFRVGKKHRQSHRVAWELVNGPIPDGMRVCHSCDVRRCCNPACLFLGTTADNQRDMMQKGRSTRGAASGRAKLTEVQIVEMRTLRAQGATLQAIGEMFGTSKSNVHYVTSGATWRSPSPLRDSDTPPEL